MTSSFLKAVFEASWQMSSSVKLFHRFITRWEKNCSRVLQWQWFFTSFQLWPLVILSSALWKKTDQGVAAIPFTILKISSKSALFQRSSKDHNPNWWSLSSYGASPWDEETGVWTDAELFLTMTCLYWSEGARQLNSNPAEVVPATCRDWPVTLDFCT